MAKPKHTAVMTFECLDNLVHDVCDTIEMSETIDGNIELNVEHIRDVVSGLLQGYGVIFVPDES